MTEYPAVVRTPAYRSLRSRTLAPDAGLGLTNRERTVQPKSSMRITGKRLYIRPGLNSGQATPEFQSSGRNDLKGARSTQRVDNQGFCSGWIRVSPPASVNAHHDGADRRELRVEAGR